MNISKVRSETFEKIELYLDAEEVKNLWEDLEIISLDLGDGRLARTYCGQYFVENLRERAKKNQSFEIVINGSFIRELIYEINMMLNFYSGRQISFLLLSHLQYSIMSDNKKSQSCFDKYVDNRNSFRTVR